MNPIFQASSNHRYDTQDFMKIDPMLGTEEDFKNLIKDLHKNRIALILDGVFNHVGADSKYFLSAVTDKTGPYYSWFNFINYPTKYQSWWGEPRFLTSTRVMLTTRTSSAGPTAF